MVSQLPILLPSRLTPLWIPTDVADLCYSTPWRSKGYHEGHKYMAQAVADALWRWSDGGALPIVVDAASCTLGLKEDIVTQLEGQQKMQYESLKIIDSIAWCRDESGAWRCDHHRHTKWCRSGA
jgi:D-lactate dehydrogenase